MLPDWRGNGRAVTDFVGTHHLLVIDTGDGSAITSWNRRRSALLSSSPSNVRPSAMASAAPPTSRSCDCAGRAAVNTAPARTLACRDLLPGGYTATIGMNGRIGSGFLRHRVFLLIPAGSECRPWIHLWD